MAQVKLQQLFNFMKLCVKVLHPFYVLSITLFSSWSCEADRQMESKERKSARILLTKI
jgi:hypothetical protein